MRSHQSARLAAIKCVKLCRGMDNQGGLLLKAPSFPGKVSDLARRKAGSRTSSKNRDGHAAACPGTHSDPRNCDKSIGQSPLQRRSKSSGITREIMRAKLIKCGNREETRKVFQVIFRGFHGKNSSKGSPSHSDPVNLSRKVSPWDEIRMFPLPSPETFARMMLRRSSAATWKSAFGLKHCLATFRDPSGQSSTHPAHGGDSSRYSGGARIGVGKAGN